MSGCRLYGPRSRTGRLGARFAAGGFGLAAFGFSAAPVFAAEMAVANRTLELDFPQTALGWWGLVGGFVLLILFVVLMYWRDAAGLSPVWKTWLTALRIGVVLGVLAIVLNPHERTERTAHRPSRVAVLVDTSLSMRYPDKLPSSGAPSAGDLDTRTRAEAVEEVLARSPLIETLRRDHEVTLYTFDSSLSKPHHVFTPHGQAGPPAAGAPSTTPVANPSGAGAEDDVQAALSQAALNWTEILQPRGLETRLGESLLELMRQAGGSTLSGIVVISDGGSNAGIEPSSAHEAARSGRVRLLTVGVGSTQQPRNLQVASIQAPTDVHIGDAFDISAFIQGQGLAGQQIEIELLMKPEGADGQPVLLETREEILGDDGTALEVKFERQPGDAGAHEYVVRAKTAAGLQELDDQDNELSKTINTVDRKTRVLLLAGGPMRDYQFVRNMLYRHPAVEVDVWLQSAVPGTAVSQEADKLLHEFPEAREELYGYDVVIAFDPDWSRLSSEQIEMLGQWTFSESGGLILVAGDVHTPQLAGGTDELRTILELYPVFLSSYLLDFQFDSRSEQAWPVEFTRDGENAGFLQLADGSSESSRVWQEFGGFYRSYPTVGQKAGASVYAHFSDPRTQTEYGFPVLLASQFYGAGRTLYVGSPELWRLRSLDEEYYDRFWTKTIREVGKGRLKRGADRGVLLLERDEYYLGQTVRVRSRLLDPQFQPLEIDELTFEVYDPSGKPMVPPRRMARDQNRPGQFVGDFHAGMPGRYRIELEIPDSQEQLRGEVSVRLPNLEADNPRLNAQLLRSLADDTGGGYWHLDEVDALPARLPNRSEEFIIDERLRTLWDRRWVLFLLVGLLSAEWLTRKLLKLA